MKINNNKIINIFLSTVAIFLLAFITGCTGFSNSKSSEKYVLRGRVSSSVRKSSPSSKNATVSINLDAVQFEITAKKFDEATQTFEEAVYEPEDYESGTAFSFTFNKTGRYKITVKAKQSGKVFAQGSEFVTIEDEDTEPVIIKLSLQGEGTAVGNVHLPVYLSNDIETVTSLEVRWEEDRDFDATYPFEDGVATIDVEDIDSGTYHIKLNFLDNKGNALYSCSEMVMVYTGCTTNVWYGTAPYLNSTGKFTLTNSLISAHHANILPNTKTLLFEYSIDEEEFGNTSYGYNYYLVNDANISEAFSTGEVDSMSTMYDVNDKWVFDSQGNFYLLQFSSDTDHMSSTKEGWATNVLLYDNAPANADPDAYMALDEYNTKAVCIDLATDILYALNVNGDSYTLYKYPDLISSGGTVYSHESITLDIFQTSSECYISVRNNLVYGLCKTSSNYLFWIVEINDSSTSSSVCYMSEINLPSILELEDSEEVSGIITDMMVQGDSVYMLYNEVSHNWNSMDYNLYSRGAVIQFNTITNRFSKTGFTDNVIAKDSGYKLACVATDEVTNIDKLMYTEEGNLFVPTDETALQTASESYPDIHCPASTEKSFYGPTRFVAIRPKQLVISDEGFAYYTDDDFLHCKNVNRIVYVDLEDFAIRDIKSNIGNGSASMGMDDKDYIKGVAIIPEARVSYYDKNHNVNEADCYFAAVINDDCED